MSLSSEYQQPSTTQQAGAIFSAVLPEEISANVDESFSLEEVDEKAEQLAALFPANTLSILETRLQGMAKMIADLNAKNNEMRKALADRNAYIAEIEQENFELDQQITSFASVNSQVIDGLAAILSRFPGGEEDNEENSFDYSDTSLLDETVGTA